MRAVVSGIIIKMAEMGARGATNHLARIRFHFLVTSIIHYISSYLVPERKACSCTILDFGLRIADLKGKTISAS